MAGEDVKIRIFGMEIKEIRRARLRKWFTGKKLPEKEKSYLSQLLNGKASFGERAAGRLEREYGMDAGYLSQPLSDDPLHEPKVEQHLSQRQLALLGLFDGLTESQQDEVISRIQSQKQSNDAIMDELMKKRQRA
jgi:transcriptional regulator with XRE-family HTH domain